MLLLLLFIFDFSTFFILFHSFSGYFTMSPALLASHACEGLHQLWAQPRLLLIAFSFSSTASTTVLSGHFLPTGVFYLMLLPNILAQPAFVKVSLEASSYSLKFAGLHSDPRNTDPAHLFVWFTVMHNVLYILICTYTCQYCKSFTCGENFHKISSHSIQQPWKYKAASKLIRNYKF